MGINFSFAAYGDRAEFAKRSWEHMLPALGLPDNLELGVPNAEIKVGEKVVEVKLILACHNATQEELKTGFTYAEPNSPDLILVASLPDNEEVRKIARIMAQAAKVHFVDASKLLRVREKNGDYRTWLLDQIRPDQITQICCAGPELFDPQTLGGRRAMSRAVSNAETCPSLLNEPAAIRSAKEGTCLILPAEAVEKDLSDAVRRELRLRNELTRTIFLVSGAPVSSSLAGVLEPFCVITTGAEDKSARKTDSIVLPLSDEIDLLKVALKDARTQIMPDLHEVVAAAQNSERAAAVDQAKQILARHALAIDQGDEARRILQKVIQTKSPSIFDAGEGPKTKDVSRFGLDNLLTEATTKSEKIPRKAASARLGPIEIWTLNAKMTNDLNDEIRLSTLDSYRRVARVIEVYLQRFVATKVATHIGDILPQVFTNSLFPEWRSGWSESMDGAITEIARQKTTDSYGQVHLESQNEMSPAIAFWPMLFQTAKSVKRLAGMAATITGVILTYVVAKVVAFNVPQADVGYKWAAILGFAVAVAMALGYVFIQIRPNLLDARYIAYGKLQRKVERAIVDLQKAIHADMSELLVQRIDAWQRDFAAQLIQGIGAKITKSVRETQFHWIEYGEALERELLRLESLGPERKAPDSVASAKAELRRSLRRSQLWRGTIMGGAAK